MVISCDQFVGPTALQQKKRLSLKPCRKLSLILNKIKKKHLSSSYVQYKITGVKIRRCTIVCVVLQRYGTSQTPVIYGKKVISGKEMRRKFRLKRREIRERYKKSHKEELQNLLIYIMLS
jgi:hypothetical protein